MGAGAGGRATEDTKGGSSTGTEYRGNCSKGVWGDEQQGGGRKETRRDKEELKKKKKRMVMTKHSGDDADNVEMPASSCCRMGNL